jgi:acetylornithine/succinyldiaminopimelate/putrescine aminotransferase
VLTGPHAQAVQDAARAAGFLVNAVQPDAVRLAPPLILTGEEAQSLVDALPFILDAAAKEIH